MAGTLKSTHGAYVYYQGRVDFNNWYCSDSGPMKYGDRTKARTHVARGGNISMITTGWCASGGSKVQSRIVKDMGILPDPAGAWSAKY